MNNATLNAATEHALREYPKESCGLVIAKGRKEVYVPCRNISNTPTEHFRIHPDDMMAAEDEGKITHVVHSHPDGPAELSEGDRLQMEESKVKWCIIAVHKDPATPDAPARVVGNRIEKPSGYKAPLVGREFIFGVQDCYTLVRDFYEREMGVVIPDFERTDRFWERGEDLYMDNFAKAGFTRIPYPSQKGDGILMAIRSNIVNHAGIWLGERDHMIHHPYGHLSERVVYGGYWRENTRVFVRRIEG